MAEEANLIKVPDMGAARAIDFVNRFNKQVNGLQRALNITNILPLRQGNEIKLYKFITEMAEGNGAVAEGEVIPLSHVKKEKVDSHPVALKKYRKAVSAEEIQRVGFEAAVRDSDRAIMREIQGDVKKGFFDFLATAPTDLGEVKDVQAAMGKAWGKVNELFEDDVDDVIVFINPLDAGDYLGAAAIENGNNVGFGITLLEGFVNVKIAIFAGVPKGTIYATATNNLNIAFIDARGELRKMFVNKPVFTDETGFIGYVHDDNTTNLTHQTTYFTGVALFAEILDGVVKMALPATV